VSLKQYSRSKRVPEASDVLAVAFTDDVSKIRAVIVTIVPPLTSEQVRKLDWCAKPLPYYVEILVYRLEAAEEINDQISFAIDDELMLGQKMRLSFFIGNLSDRACKALKGHSRFEHSERSQDAAHAIYEVFGITVRSDLLGVTGNKSIPGIANEGEAPILVEAARGQPVLHDDRSPIEQVIPFAALKDFRLPFAGRKIDLEGVNAG